MRRFGGRIVTKFAGQPRNSQSKKRYIPQNSPIVQFDTALTQSQTEINLPNANDIV